MNPDRGPQLKQITYPKNPGESLSETHYFDVMQNIFETIGRDTPLYKMADSLCVQLGIPNGHTSALTTSINSKTGKRERSPKDVEQDRIIGTVFANIPGVYVGIGKNKLEENAPVSTMDINKILDVLEKGQPGLEIKFQEFINALPEKDRSIILGERDLRKRKKGWSAELDIFLGKINYPVVYFRLSGGVGIFLRGYLHHKRWQKLYGAGLIEIYAHNSSIVLIEGFHDDRIGESLELRWGGNVMTDDYDILMRGIANENSKILFGEIDGRFDNNVQMDFSDNFNSIKLPFKFYENYYEYLKKINPKFIEKIKDFKDLKEILELQSTSYQGTDQREISIERDKYTGVGFHTHPSVDEEKKISPEMTGFELGQTMYADALSAVKLHLLAKLSNDGHLPSGPIVDFEGAAHLHGKTFFIQYPQYAIMVVLMNIHELMAGTVEKLKTNNKTAVEYSKKIFSNPDWRAVIKEILKLPIMSIQQDPQKTVAPGPNQKKLIDQSSDYAEIYGLDIPEMAKTLQEKFN